MKKLFESDNALKVLSVIIAIFIWIYIAIVMDPAIVVSVRDLPIQFVGQESLNERGLAIISESATTVSIKIKGSRKKMGNNDMKTIIAKADAATIWEAGVHTVPVEIVIPFENQGISSQTLYAVDVKAEKIASKDFDIEIKTSGTLGESYMSGDMTVEPSKVTVTGPESAVEKLSKAVVKLNYNGADVDIDEVLPIVFYNEEDKEMPAVDAILKRVKLSVSEAKVHCPVLKIREIQPTIDFGWQQLPEDFSYKVEPSVLYVYGEEAGAAKVQEIKTEIVPLEKLIDNEKIKVKLIIPNGVKILYDTEEVEISIKK
ncbi:MAG: hypothetical protein IJA16_02970 [Clostridia bacterium]|nr:hypothetical protein [Clostridia bacterium]